MQWKNLYTEQTIHIQIQLDHKNKVIRNWTSLLLAQYVRPSMLGLQRPRTFKRRRFTLVTIYKMHLLSKTIFFQLLPSSIHVTSCKTKEDTNMESMVLSENTCRAIDTSCSCGLLRILIVSSLFLPPEPPFQPGEMTMTGLFW